MRKRRLPALILALALLAGCAPAAEAPSPTPSPAAVSASPSPEPTPAPTPEPVKVDFREFLDGVNAARKAVIAQEEPIDISAYIHLYLPHSGLPCYFGTGLIFNETNENRDGAGYLPDLWVEPTKALDAVKRLIEYYGLNAEQ